MRKLIFNFLYILTFVLYCLPTTLWSQDSLTLNNFNGGSINAELFYSYWLFNGTGSKSSSMAGVFNSFEPNVEDIFNNPAGIGQVIRSGFMLELSPPLPVSITSFFDGEKNIQDVESEMLKEMFDTIPADLTSLSNLKAGQTGAVNSAGIVIPMKYANIGFGYTNPLDFRLEMLGSGIEMLIKKIPTPKAPEGVTAQLSMDLILDMEMRTHLSSIVISREFAKGFAGGISIDNYSAQALFLGNLVTQGIVRINRDFDLNDDAYRNFANVDYKGRGLGSRIGLNYHFEQPFTIDAFLLLTPKIDLRGEMTVIQDQLELIDFTRDQNKIICVGCISDVSDPFSGTTTKNNPTSNTLTMRMPNSFNVGFGYHTGDFGVGLSYSKYFDELSYQFIDSKLGLGFTHGFRFGMDSRSFKMGLGLLTFNPIGFDIFKDKPVIKILSNIRQGIMPLATMGFGFPIGKSINVNTVIWAFPLSLFKTTLTYNWDIKKFERPAPSKKLLIKKPEKKASTPKATGPKKSDKKATEPKAVEQKATVKKEQTLQTPKAVEKKKTEQKQPEKKAVEQIKTEEKNEAPKAAEQKASDQQKKEIKSQ